MEALCFAICKYVDLDFNQVSHFKTRGAQLTASAGPGNLGVFLQEIDGGTKGKESLSQKRFFLFGRLSEVVLYQLLSAPTFASFLLPGLLSLQYNP